MPPEDNKAPEAPQNSRSLVNVVVVVLGSLGLLGGGGGAYLVNDNVSELQNNMQTTLAVVETNLTNLGDTVQKLGVTVEKLQEGFQEEFKQHVNDPNLHAQGMAKLRQEIQDDVTDAIEALGEKIREPMKKQWELIAELRERVTKLEAKEEVLKAKLEALEGQ